jgi:hypothetical protein
MKAGDTALAAGEYSGAVKHYTAAITADPEVKPPRAGFKADRQHLP